MPFDSLGDAEFDQEAHEQGDIINPLMGQIQGGAVAEGLRRFGAAMKGACVGRVPGDSHGCSPTKPEWKAGLYRSGRPERKIQAKEREHGNDREVGLRYNWTFSVHLIRERGVLAWSCANCSQAIALSMSSLADLSSLARQCSRARCSAVEKS